MFQKIVIGDDEPARAGVSGALVSAAGCPVVLTPRTAIAPRRAPTAAAEANT